MKRRLARLGIILLSWPLRLIETLEAEVQRQSCTADPTVRFLPGSLVHNAGNSELIKVGAHTLIRGRLEVHLPGARISIGSYCYVGDHSRIWSASAVTIGDRVLIAHKLHTHHQKPPN